VSNEKGIVVLIMDGSSSARFNCIVSNSSLGIVCSW
jgi:hypothetical protein